MRERTPLGSTIVPTTLLNVATTITRPSTNPAQRATAAICPPLSGVPRLSVRHRPFCPWIACILRLPAGQQRSAKGATLCRATVTGGRGCSPVGTELARRFLQREPAPEGSGGRFSVFLSRLCRREQMAHGAAHHLVPVGRIGDALEAEPEVDRVLGSGNGPFGESSRRCPGEVVGVRRAPRRRARSGPPVRSRLEGRGPLPGGDLAVIDEDSQALGRPVAGVGDGDLDLLAGEAAQVDPPLLPAAGVPRGGVPGAGGPGGIARRGARLGLIVVQLRVQGPPASRVLLLAALPGGLGGVP